MMPLLRKAKDAYQTSSLLAHEVEAIRLIMLYGSASKALPAAIEVKKPAGVIATLKAAAAAITTSSGGDVIGPNVFPGFSGSMRTASVFDAVASEAMSVSFWTKVGMMSSVLTGSKVAEGASKPAQVPLFSQGQLVPEKSVSLVAVTKEFLEGSPNSQNSLLAQLQGAVGTASDVEFLADIVATNSEASTGEPFTLIGIMNDILLVLLPMVDVGARSSLFLVVGLDQARALTYVAMGAGHAGMTPLGGVFAGLRVLVSDSLPANTIALIDATGLAVAQTPVMFRSSGEALIELATNPTGTSGPSVTASNMTSMFQTNSIALLCERSLAFAPVRPNAFTSLSNITWGVTAESPLP